MADTINNIMTQAGLASESARNLEEAIAAKIASVSGAWKAGTSSDATTNTAGIQALLDAGGEFDVTGSGTILINDTLWIDSDTTMRVGKAVRLKMSPGINKPLLMTRATQRFLAGGTSVTVTQGTGSLASVSWTGHPFVLGDAAWLWNASSADYNGVHRVVSVTNANTFVVQLPFRPAAGPGTGIKAARPSQRVEIVGGLWDYDFTNNQDGAGIYVHGIGLYGAADSKVRAVKVTNVHKYGVCTCATLNVQVLDIESANRSDAVKIYGPAMSTRVRNVSGVAKDDVLSLQAKEPPGFLPFQLTCGHITDIQCSGVSGTADFTGSIVAVYGSDDEIIDRVEIENVSGSATTTGLAVRLIKPGEYTYGRMGTVTLRDVGGMGNQYGISCEMPTIKKLRIERTRHNPPVLDVSVDVPCIVLSGTLTFVEIDGGDSTAPNTGGAPFISLSSTSELVTVRGFILAGAAGMQDLVRTSAGTQVLVLENNVGDSQSNYLASLNSVTTGMRLVLRNNRWKGAGCLESSLSGAQFTVVLQSNSIRDAYKGIVRLGATQTISLISDGGNDFGSSPVLQIPSGSPTVTMRGNDLGVDIGGSGMTKTTSGQYCFNTASGRGTVVQNRLVTCNGSAWVQVDDPTKSF